MFPQRHYTDFWTSSSIDDQATNKHANAAKPASMKSYQLGWDSVKEMIWELKITDKKKNNKHMIKCQYSRLLSDLTGFLQRSGQVGCEWWYMQGRWSILYSIQAA